MKTPIDFLKNQYESAEQHLDAIVNAIASQFEIPETQHSQLHKAIRAAFIVGRGTITTDDWCNSF
jgi:hypothetical protein